MQHYDPFENWQQWKYHYHKELWHPVGYEEQFVDMVLSQINCIIPSDVIPQWRFVDEMGGNRYVDFVIINEAKGYNLAIELDGLIKLQDGVGNLDYRKYGDLWLRQNDLMGKVGMLLRFTNQQMKYRTQWVIDKVINALNQQSHQHTTHVSMINSYENRIAELQAKADSSQQIQDSIAMLQQQLLEIKANQLAASAQSVSKAIEESPAMARIPTSQEILAEQAKAERAKAEQPRADEAKRTNPPPLPTSTKQDRLVYWIGGGVLAVLVIGLVFGFGQSTQTAQPMSNESVSTYTPAEPVTVPVPIQSDAIDAHQDEQSLQSSHESEAMADNPVTIQPAPAEVHAPQVVIDTQPAQRVQPSVQVPVYNPKPEQAPVRTQEQVQYSERVTIRHQANTDPEPETLSERGTRTEIVEERADRDTGEF